MEAVFVNFVKPGDCVVIELTAFGTRMCDVATRAGAEVVKVEEEWGRAIDPQRLLDAHLAGIDSSGAMPKPRLVFETTLHRWAQTRVMRCYSLTASFWADTCIDR